LCRASGAPEILELFWVRDDGQDDVLVAVDFELEAPALGYAALPDVQALAVFLVRGVRGDEGWRLVDEGLEVAAKASASEGGHYS
jgi:hypothetical protein